MIYDYQCRKCGEVFEVQATLAQKEAGLQPTCPECGSQQTQQVFRSLNIGSGTKSSAGGNFTPPGCGPEFGAGCC